MTSQYLIYTQGQQKQCDIQHPRRSSQHCEKIWPDFITEGHYPTGKAEKCQYNYPGTIDTQFYSRAV